MDSALREATEEAILERLTAGESLNAICKTAGMPDRKTVQRWQDSDADFNAAVTHARETGYHALAEIAVSEAVDTSDPVKGRLAFDARRWYLGKLSNAFSDNKPQKLDHAGTVNVKAIGWNVVDSVD